MDDRPDDDRVEPGSQARARPPRNRKRDFWQLDVPLALVLILCTTLTVVELSRATEGIWRAWVYTFEWPLIGLFAIWMWYRFRNEGNPVRGVTQRWRDRVAAMEAEASRADSAQPPAAVDPELDAWQGYVDDLHRREPPGQPD